MRPHLLVDFKNYTSLAVDPYHPDNIVNRFNLTMTAKNIFSSKEINTHSINITMLYEEKKPEKHQAYYIMGLIAGCLLLFSIIYIEQCMTDTTTKEDK